MNFLEYFGIIWNISCLYKLKKVYVNKKYFCGPLPYNEKKRCVYEKVQKILKIFLLYKDYSIELLW